MRECELLIIGAGPAGLSAAVYATRYGLDTVVLEKKYAGGQIAATHLLENYLGFENGVSGLDFANASKAQAERLGAEIVSAEAHTLERTADGFRITTLSDSFRAKAVIFAPGAYPRKLGIEGEEELIGSGVSFCATCDGAFFRGRDVCVIGGGDTALGDALYLSELANKVYIVHRRDEFRGSAAIADKVRANGKIELVLNSVPVRYTGADNFALSGLVVKDKISGEERTLDINGCFEAVGNVPDTELVRGLVDMDEAGYVLADESTKTRMAGMFVAGDSRKKPLRQVVTAASDGAVAAFMAYEYIRA